MKTNKYMRSIMAMLLSLAMMISMAPYTCLPIYAEDGSGQTETVENADTDEAAEPADPAKDADPAEAAEPEEPVEAAEAGEVTETEESSDPAENDEDAEAADESADSEAASEAATDSSAEDQDADSADENTDADSPDEEAAEQDESEGTKNESIKQTVKAGKATVTAEYAKDVFAEDVELSVKELKEGSAEFRKAEKAADKVTEEKIGAVYAYDITFRTADGKELEPTDDVKIRIEYKNPLASDSKAKLGLVHIADNGRAEVVESAKISDDAAKVTFRNDEFSVYVVTAEKTDGSYQLGDGTEYDTLEEAIAASGDGEVILVTEDVLEENSITIEGKTITLLAYDRDVTLALYSSITVEPGAKLILGNGKGGKKLTLWAQWKFYLNGGLTVNSDSRIRLDSDGYGAGAEIEAWGYSGNCNIIVNGGTIEKTDGGDAVTVDGGATLELLSGSISAVSGNAVNDDWGKVTVKGGKISAPAGYDAINIGEKSGSLEVSDGVIIGGNALFCSAININNPVKISGGVFKALDESGYAVSPRAKADFTSGVETVRWSGKLDEGTYTVTEGYGPSTDTVSVNGVDGDFHYFARQKTITYDGNGGKTSSNAESFTEGTTGTITVAVNPFNHPDGRIFKEWNTKDNGTGDSYAEESELTPDGDMTLYAIWDEAGDAVEINGVFYDNITEAMAAASDGDTLIVHKSTKEPGAITVDKSVTIVAISGRVVAEKASLKVESGKNLTLGDGDASKKIVFRGDAETAGELTLNDGAEIYCSSSSAINVKNGGIYTGNGGKVTTTGAYALYVADNGTVTEIKGGSYKADDSAIFGYGTIGTISGGSFRGKSAGAKANSGMVIETISGGIFTGTNSDGTGIMTRRASIGTISGGDFIGGADSMVEQVSPNGYGLQIGTDSKVDTISGGNFHAAWGILLASSASGPLSITGGTFYGENTALQVQNGAKASIAGGEFSGNMGITNFGTVTGISDVKVDTKNASFVNYSECGDIKDSTFHSKNTTAITNTNYFGTIGSIEIIENCTVSTDGVGSRSYALDNNNDTNSISSIRGGSFSAAGTAIRNNGSIGDISGASVSGASGNNTDVISNYGSIGEIKDGTEVTYNGNAWTYAALKNWADGQIESISGGSFKGEAGMALNNQGTIEDISGGSFSVGDGYYCFENDGTVTEIKGGEFVADGTNSWYALINYGDVDQISGGLFKSNNVGLYNYDGSIGIIKGKDTTFESNTGLYNRKTIDTISGGRFKGLTGIKNYANSTIGSISVAEEGDLVAAGTDGPALLNSGTATISGKGVYIGTDNAIEETDGSTTLLEPGLASIIGNGRYQTSTNTSASELKDVKPPEGYHIVWSTTDSDVEGGDGEFRFLIKDNTIIYDGNGHDLADDSVNDKTDVIEGSDPVLVSYEADKVKTSANSSLGDVHYNEVADGNEKTFIGWTTTSDGKDSDGVQAGFYKAGDPVQFVNDNYTDIRLYAQWGVRLTYKVIDSDTYMGSVKKNDAIETFADGVVTELASANEDVAAGFGILSEAKGATAESADGEKYRFVNWTSSDDAEVSKNASYAPDAVPEANTVYQAHFAHLWDVTFDPDGGEPVPDAQKVMDGEKAEKPEHDPEKTGHSFEAWFRKVGDTVEDIAFNFADPINENTELKARWKVNKYTITFDSNGGSPVDPITQDYGTDVKAPADPTREGYTFDGWDKDIPSTMPAENMTITAKWKVNQYKVTYKYLGTVPAGASELPAAADHDYGSAVKVAYDATAPGYTFSGWSRDDFTMPAEDVEITGTFTANGDTPYKVEHYKAKLDGGYEIADTDELKGKTDTEATANPKTYEGFSFNKDAEGTKQTGNIDGDGSLVLRLYYDRNQYTITFDSNGGSAVNSITQDYGTDVKAPADPTREGYAFDGWDRDIPSTMPAENMIIKANWKVNQYKVTYRYVGTVPAGASELPAAADQDYGSEVKVADDATAPGYTFSGWSRDDFTMPAEDVEIIGTFTANGDTPYKVEHYKEKLDGGYEIANTDELKGKTDTEVTANPKTYEGFSFNKDAEDTKQTGSIAGDGSLVLKLYYDRNEYTITFDSNGGSPVEPITQKYGTDVKAPADPAREGYTFDSWNSEIPSTMPAENLTVKAQWTAVPAEEEPEEPEPSTPTPTEPDDEPAPSDPTPSEPDDEPTPTTPTVTDIDDYEPTPTTPTVTDIDDDEPTPSTPAPTRPARPATTRPAATTTTAPAAPATPAVAPDNTQPEQIEEQPVPQTEPETIPEPETPKAEQPEENNWALLNLIAAALSTVGAALALRRRREDDDEDGDGSDDDDDDDEERSKKRKLNAYKAAGAAAAVASIIAFILTEDMSNPMILADRWTILMAILFAGQAATAYGAKKAAEDDSESTEEE